MSETRNGARTGLVVFGLLAGIAGVILWIVGAGQLAHDTNLNDISASIGGYALGNTDGDQTMIWFGIALLVVGVILLLARFIIAAARR